jgi:hypothetical protein
LDCKCDKCSQSNLEVHEATKDSIIKAIPGKDQKSYISVFAFLYKLKRVQLIHKFLNNEYTDQRLSDPDFISEKFPNFSEDRVLSKQGFIDIFGTKDKYNLFFEFFVPTLKYDHRLSHRSINTRLRLPCEIIRVIGAGGYSVVYEAHMLDGYHDFKDIDRVFQFQPNILYMTDEERMAK